MVKIEIYVEGGILPNPNHAAQTVNNSAALREGFHQLLTQELSIQDFDLVIKTGSGENQTISFLKANKENAIALVDLDGQKKPDKLAYLNAIDFEEKAFFMVQKMEAWILSQPNKIELFGQQEYLTRKKPEQNIANDPSIHNKHPDSVLNTLFQRHFTFIKNGKKKKKKYGKLKDAPKLIQLLDLPQLKTVFTDVKQMILYIKTSKDA